MDLGDNNLLNNLEDNMHMETLAAIQGSEPDKIPKSHLGLC